MPALQNAMKAGLNRAQCAEQRAHVKLFRVSSSGSRVDGSTILLRFPFLCRFAACLATYRLLSTCLHLLTT